MKIKTGTRRFSRNNPDSLTEMDGIIVSIFRMDSGMSGFYARLRLPDNSTGIFLAGQHQW
jgi:hypothetical protein